MIGHLLCVLYLFTECPMALELSASLKANRSGAWGGGKVVVAESKVNLDLGWVKHDLW